MDPLTASPREAIVQLLHIQPNDEIRLRRLINRIWFFYQIELINSPPQEQRLLDQLTNAPKNLKFDLFITDFTPNSPIQIQNKAKLLTGLAKMRCPLISLSDQDDYTCQDEDSNWIHITLPIDNIERHIEEANNAIANFWFCLPSMKKSFKF